MHERNQHPQSWLYKPKTFICSYLCKGGSHCVAPNLAFPNQFGTAPKPNREGSPLPANFLAPFQNLSSSFCGGAELWVFPPNQDETRFMPRLRSAQALVPA